MKLVGPWLSGYTRRVGISLNLLDLGFEHLPFNAYTQPDRVAPFSPMLRVPALQLDDGMVLLDSAAIVDYLDSLVEPERRLMPASGPERLRAARIVAYATACFDKIARYCDENMLRPPELRIATIQDRYQQQLLAGLKLLEEEARDPWYLGDKPSQADVMTIVAYQAATTVLPDVIHGEAFPRLGDLSNMSMTRPEFVSTLPTQDDLVAVGLLR